ncbi:MAG: hypothetical protein LUE99_11530 [Bacteroides sp.]|nr:hypothetical protein [Bacteroides sp.]
MNATFNLKHFLLLERYEKQETGRHLLQTAGVILGICLLCMMYDINRGGSLHDHQTQGAFIWKYVMWFLCAAPACWRRTSPRTIPPLICCCRHPFSRSSCICG